jgi:hypothetical protein
MGTSQSLPVTHEKLFELTKDTRNIMNILLEYMMKELTVRDFLSLSNPTECKKYVLFLANNLYKHFYELQIVPTKTKQGVIVFRKAQDLTAPPGKQEEQEKQGLCLTLAYFYTRIFQIYGALALTLIDDMNVASSTGMMAIMTDQQRLLTPGRQQYFATAGDQLSSMLYLGNFVFLQKYLTNKKDDPYIITNYEGTGEEKATIGFRNEKKQGDGVEKGIFKMSLDGKLIGYVDVLAAKQGSDFILEFDNMRYYKKSKTQETTEPIKTKILSSNLFTIRLVGTSYQIVDFEGSVSDFFNNVFKKIVPYLKGSSTFGEGVTETGIKEELRLSRTIQALTRDKPLGHCIARALQLLQSNPFDNKTALSNICQAKFLERTIENKNDLKTKISRSGIPEPGASLDRSPGLASLSQLFYEIAFQATPKVFTTPQIGISSLQEYRTFMENMSKLFQDPKKLNTNDDIRRTTLKDIINRRDKEECAKISTSGTEIASITVPIDVAKNVNQYVRQLFQKQYEHTVQCGAIFNELFSIKRDPQTKRLTISLKERILQNGLPEIARINGKARRLLANYYTRCEDIYRNGMNVIVQYKVSQQASAPTTATATPTATPAPTPTTTTLTPTATPTATTTTTLTPTATATTATPTGALGIPGARQTVQTRSSLRTSTSQPREARPQKVQFLNKMNRTQRRNKATP